MSYQLCNTKNPNSKENTVVFNIFEAKDQRSNLKLALSRNKQQINQLQNMTWQYIVYIYIPSNIFLQKNIYIYHV